MDRIVRKKELCRRMRQLYQKSANYVANQIRNNMLYLSAHTTYQLISRNNTNTLE